MPPTLTQQANALTPGDWASLRDLIREVAAILDNLSPSEPGPNASTVGAGNNGTPPAPTKEN
jgi:hypothetical protein